MDPGAVVSSTSMSDTGRRAALVARAAAHRRNLSRQLAPLASLESGLERLSSIQAKLPALSMGAGLGLTALLVLFPGSRMNVLRSGQALFHLAGSVKRLLVRR